MGNKVKRAVLFVNVLKKNAEESALNIKTELEKMGLEAEIFSFNGNTDAPLDKNSFKWTGENNTDKRWDIAFSFGGDGTVLFTARSLAQLSIPILSVNLGTLGFIAGVDRNSWLEVFKKWNEGIITASRRCMLEISVERGSKIIMKNTCLNDAVVSASGIAKLIKLDVSINEQQTDNIDKIHNNDITLGSFRCDGLILSTPTGSTAYSMAAGGPILDPEMEAVIVSPICPFSLSNRPFVLPSRDTLCVTVAHQQRSGVLLTIDGQITFNLECDDKIIIKQAPCHAQLIIDGKHAYYSALRNKLFWSGDQS